MKRAEPDAIEIPGLDVPKAKRYSRTRLASSITRTRFLVLSATRVLQRSLVYDGVSIAPHFEQR